MKLIVEIDIPNNAPIFNQKHIDGKELLEKLVIDRLGVIEQAEINLKVQKGAGKKE